MRGRHLRRRQRLPHGGEGGFAQHGGAVGGGVAVQLGAELDGYSAADCAAVLREAALTAMRESLAATEVTAAHIAAARAAVPPSLDPVQLAALEAYATARG